VKRTGYIAPLYAVFSSLPPPTTSQVQILSSEPCSQASSIYAPYLNVRDQVSTFRKTLFFYNEELLAPRSTPKLEDNQVLAVRKCLLNIFVGNLHI